MLMKNRDAPPAISSFKYKEALVPTSLFEHIVHLPVHVRQLALSVVRLQAAFRERGRRASVTLIAISSIMTACTRTSLWMSVAMARSL